MSAHAMFLAVARIRMVVYGNMQGLIAIRIVLVLALLAASPPFSTADLNTPLTLRVTCASGLPVLRSRYIWCECNKDSQMPALNAFTAERSGPHHTAGLLWQPIPTPHQGCRKKPVQGRSADEVSILACKPNSFVCLAGVPLTYPVIARGMEAGFSATIRLTFNNVRQVLWLPCSAWSFFSAKVAQEGFSNATELD
ncbi:hypothetical protein P153DRAFT_390607 [Dothidotthia symphoricarpi CBS 119687]|uniref:Uncharacterized protein n=1 Tax=Dothidotthia symphoricarpi CBS 119687 TaxID=1392245 RepID=A0A6A6A0S3_9PLEO|nr:uncharacterized protein P153DRAFT_390607 [Dothidotthia symphoricarpi CBS 119687]KAF2124567.1 hypothetical protein P153DRAFT_390607 [Dothidotthia symphoricarpi CBS 119687]